MKTYIQFSVKPVRQISSPLSSTEHDFFPNNDYHPKNCQISNTIFLAIPLPYSCPAPYKLLTSAFLAFPQFLPSSCPVLLCSALLLPCSCPAPALLMLQPRYCFAPALLLPCSWSCPPQFGSLYHHQLFFGTARATFYGNDMIMYSDSVLFRSFVYD